MGGDLHFAIVDDGTGLDRTRSTDAAGGLRGLEDRVSLQRGWIAVDSAASSGTRIRGMVPAQPPVPEADGHTDPDGNRDPHADDRSGPAATSAVAAASVAGRP